MTARASTKNINHLREVLFKQLDQLIDVDQTVDLDRVRLVNETSRLIIDTAKVEVAHAAVIHGAITLPFIEGQEGAAERPYQPPLPAPRQEGSPVPSTSEGKASEVLSGGPSENHPWRGLGGRVHRMEH